jgi:hypothetical protein
LALHRANAAWRTSRATCNWRGNTAFHVLCTYTMVTNRMKFPPFRMNCQ